MLTSGMITSNMFVALYLFAIFVTFVVAFALVTFSPLRRVRQPKRSLLLGLGSMLVVGVASIPLALFGDPVVWRGLLVIGELITAIAGVSIGFLGSSEGISSKIEDEYLPKSDLSGGVGG